MGTTNVLKKYNDNFVQALCFDLGFEATADEDVMLLHLCEGKNSLEILGRGNPQLKLKTEKQVEDILRQALYKPLQVKNGEDMHKRLSALEDFFKKNPDPPEGWVAAQVAVLCGRAEGKTVAQPVSKPASPPTPSTMRSPTPVVPVKKQEPPKTQNKEPAKQPVSKLASASKPVEKETSPPLTIPASKPSEQEKLPAPPVVEPPKPKPVDLPISQPAQVSDDDNYLEVRVLVSRDHEKEKSSEVPTIVVKLALALDDKWNAISEDNELTAEQKATALMNLIVKTFRQATDEVPVTLCQLMNSVAKAAVSKLKSL